MKVLGSLEQKVMDVVWEAEKPLKPSDIQCALGDCNAYTTVMTVMKRLSDKGILTRTKNGKAYYYEAAVSKKHFAQSKLRKLFESLIDSYGELAIREFNDAVKKK